MNSTEFFLKYNGKYLDYDGVFGNQCVDVTKQYFDEVLGLPPFRGNAIDYWQDIPGFQRIKKNWFNYPQPGDIVVFNKNVSRYGHIAIVNWSRRFDMGCFEQNFPIGSPCHYQERSYKNVLGWLRPLKKPVEAPRPEPEYTAKKVFKCLVVSDIVQDPLVKEAAKFVNSKLLEFSGGRLGFEVIDYKLERLVDPTPNTNFVTDEAVPMLDKLDLALQEECDYVLVRYQGYSVWTYTVLYNNVWPVPFTIMPSSWTNIKDVFLFEVGHGLIQCFNMRRGSLPSISNSDNYSGGEQYVKAKVEAVLPYLYLFDLPANQFK